MKQPSVWTLREIDGKIQECFCTINWDYDSCHCKHSYLLVDNDKGKLKMVRVKNDRFNPLIKKPTKPLYCERKPKPSDKCYKNHCPHFAHADPFDGDEDE